MDQSFLLRARRLLDGGPAVLSFDALTSSLRVQQSGTPTAQAHASLARQCPRAEDSRRPFPGRQAGGCFNRAVAARRLNPR